MLNKMRIIAWNTFIEARRDKILGILFVFTVVLICSSTALGELAIGEDRGTKVIRDFSVSAISLMCLLITIFLGTSIVSKEVEKRTIYTILSKHCTRSTFICGKFLGLITTYTICMLGMAVISALVYRFYGGEFQPSLLLILLGLFLELLFLNAIALFFAVAFTSPILAAVLTFVFYVCGHATELMQPYVKETIGEGRTFISFLYHLLPNFRNFDYNQVLYSPQSPSELSAHVLYSSSYALVYTLMFLGATILIFRKKNF